MPFILRSGQRALHDPIYLPYEPMSVTGWSEEPDLSWAPLEAWEQVEDLEAALRSASPFGPAIQATAEPIPSNESPGSPIAPQE